MRIQILLTGNELLSGDIIDSNSAYISQQLSIAGFNTHRRVTIGDDLIELTEEIRLLSQQSDILIINGGLGPTDDDLTMQAIAAAINKPLVENPSATQQIKAWCEKRGIQANAANLKQAYLPLDAVVIPNPVGSAPGVQITIGQCVVVTTPGVPSEMRAMMQNTILPWLKKKGTKESKQTSRFKVFGWGESQLQQYLHDQFPQWPNAVEVGFRAGLPLLELKLTIKSAKDLAIKEACKKELQDLIGDCIIGQCYADIPEPTMGSAVVAALKAHNKTLATAESCTGGLIAAHLTEIPGASSVFEAGFITYSNRMKSQMLKVPQQTLEQYGAVSQETVMAMLEGLLHKSHADYGVSISGIAGPDGGAKTKPVGTVWIAWGGLGETHSLCLQLPFERKTFQQMASTAALDLVRRQVLGLSMTPIWLKRYQSRPE